MYCSTCETYRTCDAALNGALAPVCGRCAAALMSAKASARADRRHTTACPPRRQVWEVIPGDSGPPCVACGVVPEHYLTAASETEHKEISGICPVCWLVELTPPDSDERAISDAVQKMAAYGVTPGALFGREFDSAVEAERGLSCLACGASVTREGRRAHFAESAPCRPLTRRQAPPPRNVPARASPCAPAQNERQER
jgi:hypothetical protein